MQKKNSWIPAAADMPPPGYYSYLLAFMEMSGTETSVPGFVLDLWNYQSYTATLSWGAVIPGSGEIYPDLAFSTLFDQTVNKTGSIATAFRTS